MTAGTWRIRLGVAAAALVTALGTTTAATAAPAAPAAPAAAPGTGLVAGGASDTSGNLWERLAPARLKGIDYDAWQRDVRAVIDEAIPYVEQRTASAPGEKTAIVFDVDNTTLETDFHLAYPTPALKPSLELARHARARGVEVFFVTARPGILYAPTEYNLRKAGYPLSGLYVRDLPDLFGEVSAYKTRKRAEIEAEGYTIIASVGNRTSDLVGGHAERTFKLPDYDGALS